MPCKHHKDALIEAAASGVEPQGELRAHLAACADCRAAFEQEQFLFSSIDAGLHASANAEVPASFLPHVRARLDVESQPNRSWVTSWLVFASATAIIVAFFVGRAMWRPVVRQDQPAKSARTSPSVHVFPPPQEHPKTPEPSAKNNSRPQPQPQIHVARNSQEPQSHSVSSLMPEVLVPHDQETLLAEYAEQWRLRKGAPLLAQDADTTILAPLQVAQIQIAELGVKLLADE
jgi:hypothetical protein